MTDIRNRMATHSPMTLDFIDPAFGRGARRAGDPLPIKEDAMSNDFVIDLTDEHYDMDPADLRVACKTVVRDLNLRSEVRQATDGFGRMCEQMLAAYAEMGGEKFRELMSVQLSLLGPNATIDDLVRALAAQGVAAPRSVNGFSHMTTSELIQYRNHWNQAAERAKRPVPAY